MATQLGPMRREKRDALLIEAVMWFKKEEEEVALEIKDLCNDKARGIMIMGVGQESSTRHSGGLK